VPLITLNEVLKVHTANLPAGRSCPGATEWCRSACYAKKSRFTYPCNKRKLEENLDVVRRTLRSGGAAGLARVLADACAGAGAGVLRIHSSGDFISPAHLLAWGLAVGELRRSGRLGGFRAWAYSRAWWLGPRWLRAMATAMEVSEGGLMIWASTDPTLPDPWATVGWPLVADISHLRLKHRRGADGVRGVVDTGAGSAGAVEPNCLKQTAGENCKTCRRCYHPAALPALNGGDRPPFRMTFLQH